MEGEVKAKGGRERGRRRLRKKSKNKYSSSKKNNITVQYAFKIEGTKA